MKSSYKGFSSRALGGASGLLAGGVLGPVTYAFLVRELSKEIKSFYIKAPVVIVAGLFGVVLSPGLILVFGLKGAWFGAELGAEKLFALMKIMFESTDDKKLHSAEDKPRIPKEDAGDAKSTAELSLLLRGEDSPTPSPLPIAPANVVPFTGSHSARLFTPPSPARLRGTRPPELHIDTNLGYSS